MNEYLSCLLCGSTTLDENNICKHCGSIVIIRGYIQHKVPENNRLNIHFNSIQKETKMSELSYIPRFRVRGKLF